jgi:hypothetical protein
MSLPYRVKANYHEPARIMTTLPEKGTKRLGVERNQNVITLHGVEVSDKRFRAIYIYIYIYPSSGPKTTKYIARNKGTHLPDNTMSSTPFCFRETYISVIRAEND